MLASVSSKLTTFTVGGDEAVESFKVRRQEVWNPLVSRRANRVRDRALVDSCKLGPPTGAELTVEQAEENTLSVDQQGDTIKVTGGKMLIQEKLKDTIKNACGFCVAPGHGWAVLLLKEFQKVFCCLFLN